MLKDPWVGCGHQATVGSGPGRSGHSARPESTECATTSRPGVCCWDDRLVRRAAALYERWERRKKAGGFGPVVLLHTHGPAPCRPPFNNRYCMEALNPNKMYKGSKPRGF
jgi:hypothetical protein